MADNKIWTTITMEFDTAAQRGEITNQTIKDAIVSLGLQYKVKLDEIKLPKTKSVVGLKVRYPSDLTPAQVAALIAALKNIFGAWYTLPVPDPYVMLGGGPDETAGLVLATELLFTEV